MTTGYQIKDQEGAHYLTLQVVGWIDIFSRKVYKDIIIENLKYCQQNKGLTIFAYVIMSNHLHLLVQNKQADLSGTIRDFKSYTSKIIIETIITGNESRREWMLNYFQHAAREHKRNSQYQFWTSRSYRDGTYIYR